MIDFSVQLSNEHLILRLPVDADSPEILPAVRESLSDLKPWMSWAHEGYSLSDVHTWIESLGPDWIYDRHYQFIICDRHDGSLIGGAGLSHVNRTWRYANLGYWIRSSRRGNGIAAQAASLVAQFGFSQVRLGRAEIVIAVGNHASYRVAEKTGAHYEGVMRNRIIVGDKPSDAWMFSLVPQDFGLSNNHSAGSLDI